MIGAIISSIYCAVKSGCRVEYFYKAELDKNVQHEMKKYSIPLIFNGVAWWVNNSIDKYFVTAICGVAINGIYAVSYKIPTMQNKNFIRFIFRNEPSDLLIRKPVALPYDSGVNKIIFLSTPITTGNIFSRKKLLTGLFQTLCQSLSLLSRTLTVR